MNEAIFKHEDLYFPHAPVGGFQSNAWCISRAGEEGMT
jgi:hypothetical protein